MTSKLNENVRNPLDYSQMSNIKGSLRMQFDANKTQQGVQNLVLVLEIQLSLENLA